MGLVHSLHVWGVMDYVRLRHRRNKGQEGLGWYLYTWTVGIESYRGHLALGQPGPQTPGLT